MKTIQLIDNIEFDVHDGHVGASVSGGADSAIMLYLMMKYCPGPITVYTCNSKQKNRRAAHYALDVIGKCIDLTGKTVEHTVFFVEVQTFDSLFSNLSTKIKEDNISKMYTSVTALPPSEVTDTFKCPTPLKDKRDSNIIRPLYNGLNLEYYSPFFNVNKKYISRLYESQDVLQELFPLTRSCESLTLTQGHCGECWWCEERNWAFPSH
jgi:7-cyano-7-deazaguanine synthase in queuosine biosynthesis